jgi:hypothetical protein
MIAELEHPAVIETAPVDGHAGEHPLYTGAPGSLADPGGIPARSTDEIEVFFMRHPIDETSGLPRADAAIGAAARPAPPGRGWPPLPARPTLADVFALRLHVPRFGLPMAVAPHGVQCAALALRAGVDEEIVLAMLLHDIGLALHRADHGWWGAQLIDPYVSQRVAWAVRHHQALRFFADPEVGYEYPQMYRGLFGDDYQPPAYVKAAYEQARRHRWYMAARQITLHDDYGFAPDAPIDMEPFLDIIGRHFRQPKEGLGLDGSPTAHMWRAILDPDRPF